MNTSIISIIAIVVAAAAIVLSVRQIFQSPPHDLPDFLSWSADDSLRNDCQYGFNASVIYHNELAKSQGITPANEDVYLRIKADCDRVGGKPLRS